MFQKPKNVTAVNYYWFHCITARIGSSLPWPWAGRAGDGWILFKSTNQSFQISIAGHVQRMDSCYVGQRMRNLELRGRRERGRPQRWFMDAVKILLTGRVLQQNQVQGRAAMCCEQMKVGWGWVGGRKQESTDTRTKHKLQTEVHDMQQWKEGGRWWEIPSSLNL